MVPIYSISSVSINLVRYAFCIIESRYRVCLKQGLTMQLGLPDLPSIFIMRLTIFNAFSWQQGNYLFSSLLVNMISWKSCFHLKIACEVEL